MIEENIPDDHQKLTFPKAFLGIVAFISIAPISLNMFGVDFGSVARGISVQDMVAQGLSKGLLLDQMFYTLTGGLHHGLLEWSAVMAAMLTIVLAFAHFAMNKDVTMPIIGVALFCSGTMDAFHTMAAMRLIDAVADNTDLIPFTWALSRGFNAAIMIFGASLCLRMKITNTRAGLWRIGIVSLIFGAISYLLINYAAHNENLPQTQFPDSLVTRPYDALPLVMFVLAIPLFWKLYRKKPNLLTAALVISLIPEIVLEAHMAFGSSYLFDNNFNIAHGLKILAYLVPFIGLVLEYIRIHREVEEKTVSIDKLLIAHKEIEEKTQALTRSNEELDNFAYIAAHDLKEPLRAIHNHAGFLLEDYEEKLDEDGVKKLHRLTSLTKRMEKLISDLLYYSRLGREKLAVKETDLNHVIDDIRNTAQDLLREKKAVIDVPKALPTIVCDTVRITEMYRNLITNAVKYNDSEEKRIEIGVKDSDDNIFYVKDNGIGIEAEFHDDIFRIFKRLHSEKAYGEGSGSGLTFVRKIIEQHDGKIWLESKPGEGTIFYFTLEGAAA